MHKIQFFPAVMVYVYVYIHITNTGGIAQLEERALCKREAPGSKPGISTHIHTYSSISLEVRTPRCGRGNPGSNPGSSIRTLYTQIFYASLV